MRYWCLNNTSRHTDNLNWSGGRGRCSFRAVRSGWLRGGVTLDRWGYQFDSHIHSCTTEYFLLSTARLIVIYHSILSTCFDLEAIASVCDGKLPNTSNWLYKLDITIVSKSLVTADHSNKRVEHQKEEINQWTALGTITLPPITHNINNEVHCFQITHFEKNLLASLSGLVSHTHCLTVFQELNRDLG